MQTSQSTVVQIISEIRQALWNLGYTFYLLLGYIMLFPYELHPFAQTYEE